jgi:methionine salvage enolase-phosphatase E1
MISYQFCNFRVTEACNRLLWLFLQPDSERDMIGSYTLQASGYVNKPMTLHGFSQAVEKSRHSGLRCANDYLWSVDSIESQKIITKNSHLRR